MKKIWIGNNMIKLDWFITQELYYYTRISDIQIQWQFSYKLSDLICFSNQLIFLLQDELHWDSFSRKILHSYAKESESGCNSHSFNKQMVAEFFKNVSSITYDLHFWEMQDFWKMWVKFWQEFWSGEQMKSYIVLVGKTFFHWIPNFWAWAD